MVVGDNSTNSSWRDWNTYRLDWTPSLSTWYVNGVKVASKTYGIPRDGCNVVLNMWSDGGNWSGNMSEGDTAVMDVQWVEWTWNTTSGDDFGCGIGGEVCNVDEEKEVGNPTSSGRTREVTRLSWTVLLGTLLGAAIML